MRTDFKKGEGESYSPLTPRLMVQLAAPHTWPAAILPVLIAVGCTVATRGVFSPLMALVLLVICILMQSSVNTFNDYFDFVKGTDSAEDNVEVTDAVLVYNHVNPRTVLMYAIGLLVAAFLLGLYVIFQAGFIPLVIALVGALMVVLYSGGKTPISYLPIGELVSGGVMGGLIPLACYQVLSGTFSWMMLLWSVPTIIGVGLIMMTNNTCDIEKDVEAQRKTLPVLLGRPKSRALYHGLLVTWACAIVLIICLWFAHGIIVLPFMVLACYPLMVGLWKNPLIPASRVGAMGQICSVNVALGAFYACALML
ncbi:UbiA family prenyltransferase [Adlercreutzia equolifaciens]|uniref:prenyltransferase n=1 Tax=Adlercreutzia equolifaciens TaxID=446660 RepID=UPI0023B03A37|nr:UbiA family prenyltransferase [Adlercreutzia equolifaciens]MDE8703181.1 UbiA family prenyltransferase [Adlercreutzia equolifaciens]